MSEIECTEEERIYRLDDFVTMFSRRVHWLRCRTNYLGDSVWVNQAISTISVASSTRTCSNSPRPP
jgi:hypothetical protein